MQKRLTPNRAICDGDRARAGLGESGSDFNAIQKKMSDWSDAFLKKFIKISKSDVWRRAAVSLLSQREGVNHQLLALSARRARLRKKRSKPSCSSRLAKGLP